MSAEVRKRLLEELKLDADFNAFCLDAFPEIYQRLSSNANRQQRINELIQAASAEEVSHKLNDWFARPSPLTPSQTLPGSSGQRKSIGQLLIGFILVAIAISLAAVYIENRFFFAKYDNKIIWYKYNNFGLPLRRYYLIKNNLRHLIRGPAIIKYFYNKIETFEVSKKDVDRFSEGNKYEYKDGMILKARGTTFITVENELWHLVDPNTAHTYDCTDKDLAWAVQMEIEDEDSNEGGLKYIKDHNLAVKSKETRIDTTIRCITAPKGPESEE